MAHPEDHKNRRNQPLKRLAKEEARTWLVAVAIFVIWMWMS